MAEFEKMIVFKTNNCFVIKITLGAKKNSPLLYHYFSKKDVKKIAYFERKM